MGGMGEWREWGAGKGGMGEGENGEWGWKNGGNGWLNLKVRQIRTPNEEVAQHPISSDNAEGQQGETRSCCTEDMADR